ncbi:hypothetical protein IMZ31_20555 (plasmid) [Pontibacillus sp. ALD_SL1]|uniref:hypothetical protein n=1 Tax=Pontibacillus sp. ALD_SL1 TaxID=2777185 RepID=UPI001A95C127|nr:hypothetical protein [Pontibacillus sp. ALD_SL1]QST02941.1 hypothetical protein IMZ31_20555 [Pontibacillus sp. ALD_SL1]
MRRYMAYVILGFCFGVVFLFFFLRPEEKLDTEIEIGVVGEIREEQAEGFSQETQRQYDEERLGFAMDRYRYEDYVLTVNQSGNKTYNEHYRGDQLVWVKPGSEPFHYQSLVSGDYLLHLVLLEGSPFFVINGKTFILYYEKEGDLSVGEPLHGVVMEIEENGEMKKHYTTTHPFFGIEKNKESGALQIVEKETHDPMNLFPENLKPYTLHMKQYAGDTWKTVGTESVTPES